VPLIENGAVTAVLDLDSPLRARFDEIDRAGCEQLIELMLVHHRKYSPGGSWRNFDDRGWDRR
jgi:putative methionine-R-sulfoxide reductase with GAF domain